MNRATSETPVAPEHKPDIASRRLHNQHLAGNPLERADDVVQWLCAVQAQDYGGAKWALAQRSAGLTDADIDKVFDSGRILRTHIMRPTWHFVSPADIRWMQALTHTRVDAVCAYYYRQLELDDGVFARSNALIHEALQGGRHLTRPELGKVLEDGGIQASGVRLAHLMLRAELDALVCSGPRRGKQFTYALIEERAPTARTLERAEALAELARRYFASHGPATVRDFVWWSGLTVADARAGLEMVQSCCAGEVVDGKTFWSAPSTAPVRLKNPTIHLLPNYDEQLIGFKDRAPTMHESVRGRVDSVIGALTAHIITSNGVVVGGWRRTIEKKSVTIRARLIVPLSDAEKTALQSAADDYGRFLGLPVTLLHE
jgi:hypothetical protein